MAKSETPRGVEATGFADNKLIENCPLVITTIDCRPKDKKTYEFDYKIAGNPQDKDALFLKDIRESTKKEESSGFFSCGGSTYKVYEGTKVESDDLGKVIGEVAKQRGASHCILYAHGLGGFGRDPLGHSYQYGERICDYYLGALELPKPSDPKK